MWILFASLNPVMEALRSLFVKKASHITEPVIISWCNNIIPLLIFSPLLFFIDLKFNGWFFFGVIGSAILNLIATILYMNSIKNGQISKVMPMMSFSPMFLLFTSPLMVGEFPHFGGIVGIILIVAGSYLLNITSSSGGIFAPFKSLLKEKGTRYMFFVSVIWGFSANFDKISINNSSNLQHIAFVNLFIFIGMTIINLYLGNFKKENFTGNYKNLAMISTFTSGAFFFHMTALSMTLVAYVVAMKRLSGIMSVILGHFILKEPGIEKRFLGASIMFAGVLLILFT